MEARLREIDATTEITTVDDSIAVAAKKLADHIDTEVLKQIYQSGDK
jgi:hypothetical protein